MILERNEVIALGHDTAKLFDFMDADKVTLMLSHQHISGEPRVTLNPAGNTLSIITKEFGEVEFFSPTFNNFLPHNLVAIEII